MLQTAYKPTERTCVDCTKTFAKIYSHNTARGDARFRDEEGRMWHGPRCNPCHRVLCMKATPSRPSDPEPKVAERVLPCGKVYDTEAEAKDYFDKQRLQRNAAPKKERVCRKCDEPVARNRYFFCYQHGLAADLIAGDEGMYSDLSTKGASQKHPVRG